MKKIIRIVTVTAVVLAAGACREPSQPTKKSTAPSYSAPPVAYVVGRSEANDKSPEPSLRLNVAVDPATPRQDLERLLNYFDKERYADYDILWVDIYFDVARARSLSTDPTAVVASLRVNRPSFREVKISDDLAAENEPAPGTQPEITTQTDEVMYLGYRGRMFDSTKQAQTLLDLMEEKPGCAIYRITWKSSEEMELSYSVEQEMLVRVRHGVSRETWSAMSYDGIKKAARGAGFGGKTRHGGNYSYVTEQGEEKPGEEG